MALTSASVGLQEYATIFGSLSIADDPNGRVIAAGFVAADELIRSYGLQPLGDNSTQVQQAAQQYAQGNLGVFDVLSVKPTGTDFQLQVWNVIAQIPMGRTLTYAQVAAEVGRPAAVRAVGTACGRNRIAPMIPCHRVVPSSGGVGSYGFGSELKTRLLDAEAHLLRSDQG